MQPVSQLHEKNANILGHGQHEFSQVFRLAFVVGGGLQAGELGHALDQLADFGTEQTVDIGAGNLRVLDHVVQQRGDYGRGIQPIVGEDAGHLDRVGEIGIAGGPGLGPVHLHRIDIGPVEQVLVGAGVVGLDPLDQLILPQELRRRSGFSLGGLGVRLRGRAGREAGGRRGLGEPAAVETALPLGRIRRSETLFPDRRRGRFAGRAPAPVRSFARG